MFSFFYFYNLSIILKPYFIFPPLTAFFLIIENSANVSLSFELFWPYIQLEFFPCLDYFLPTDNVRE